MNQRACLEKINSLRDAGREIYISTIKDESKRMERVREIIYYVIYRLSSLRFKLGGIEALQMNY